MTKKIVIIDDEPSFCGLLEEMIYETVDYSVTTFTSSQEALPFIEKEKPDAIFVDMLMPGIDGGSVIKMIRDLLSPVPFIVMVTGMVSEDEVSRLNFPVLAKPVNKNSLLKILHKLND